MAPRLTEPLSVENPDFLVYRSIEQAPTRTMLRELMQNGIESAAQAPKGQRQVLVEPEIVDGVPKLSIWNTGPGMSPVKLRHATNLGTQIDKRLGLHDNFGIGAKVSSLKENRLGMIYRTCHQSHVSQAMLWQDPDTKMYGRKIYWGDSGEKLGDVIDVSSHTNVLDRTQDWTRVTLLGNRPDQDTTTEVFENAPNNRSMIATAILHRFYRLPDGVEILFHAGIIGRNVPFKPLGALHEKFVRHETVEVKGLKIHFLHDPSFKKKQKGTGTRRHSTYFVVGQVTSTAAIVYKNEMYDLKKGQVWESDAPKFGIPFGASEFHVHIELPDDAQVMPNTYRDAIMDLNNQNERVTMLDYAAVVRDHKPAWVQAIIDMLSTPAGDMSDVDRELRRFMDELQSREQHHRHDPITGMVADLINQGQPRTGSASGGGSGNGSGARAASPRKSYQHTPDGATTTSLHDSARQTPRYHFIETDDEIQAKQLHGFAARYYLETHEIFVNTKCAQILKLKEWLIPEFEDCNRELATRQIEEAARKAILLLVAKAVIFARHEEQVGIWSTVNIETATQPPSLSIAASGWRDMLPQIRKSVRRAIALAQVEPAGREELEPAG